MYVSQTLVQQTHTWSLKKKDCPNHDERTHVNTTSACKLQSYVTPKHAFTHTTLLSLNRKSVITLAPRFCNFKATPHSTVTKQRYYTQKRKTNNWVVIIIKACVIRFRHARSGNVFCIIIVYKCCTRTPRSYISGCTLSQAHSFSRCVVCLRRRFCCT